MRGSEVEFSIDLAFTKSLWRKVRTSFTLKPLKAEISKN
jgi:hypothetical protein